MVVVYDQLQSWYETNAECRRAEQVWKNIMVDIGGEICQNLSPKEFRHLRHSTFRINGLMHLYSTLRRQPHNTQLGVLSGMITHLLDYFYDHRLPTSAEIADMEKIISLKLKPQSSDWLENALYHLAKQTWAIIPNPHMVRDILSDMLGTQKDSLHQVEPVCKLTSEEMKHITKMKGYHSVCLYFSLANPNFTSQEANCLVSFGYYMQYMDDLEDFYEDQKESRRSLISSIDEGVDEATRLLKSAQNDLATLYDHQGYDYHMARNKVLFYHYAIRYYCLWGEYIRALPVSIKKGLAYSQEITSRLIPFFYMAPVNWAE
ncbi:MAG TPA: hypothetical protein VLL52_20160 [Anaerolineae bacterium]|nr:hypothetical protein [Anaerolineae bacterium]